MNFRQLISLIGKKLGQDALGPLQHYATYPPPLTVSHVTYGSPLLLSTEELNHLLDCAIRTPITLSLHGNNVNLLTLLIDMGTYQARKPDEPEEAYIEKNTDTLLGKKDIRLEQAIIQRAKNSSAMQVSTGSRHHAIFGFSANPPTKNHLAFINHLTEHYDMVDVIPAGQSTFKKPEDYAPVASRVRMTEALCHDIIQQDKYRVDYSEVNRCPPSRMIATLSKLTLQSTNTSYTLTLGMDGLKSFTRWYGWHDFSDVCEVKFYPRKGPEGEITPEEMHQALSALLTPEPPNTPMRISLVFQSEEKRAPFHAVLEQFIPLGLNVSIENVTMEAGSATAIRACYQTRNHAHHHEQHPDVTSAVHEVILEDACYQATSALKKSP